MSGERRESGGREATVGLSGCGSGGGGMLLPLVSLSQSLKMAKHRSKILGLDSGAKICSFESAFERSFENTNTHLIASLKAYLSKTYQTSFQNFEVKPEKLSNGHSRKQNFEPESALVQEHTLAIQ